MRLRSRSNGPSKTSRCTWNAEAGTGSPDESATSTSTTGPTLAQPRGCGAPDAPSDQAEDRVCRDVDQRQQEGRLAAQRQQEAHQHDDDPPRLLEKVVGEPPRACGAWQS